MSYSFSLLDIVFVGEEEAITIALPTGLRRNKGASLYNMAITWLNIASQLCYSYLPCDNLPP